uniref:beta strand repeat-containing protein n=1 Tax=Synechococcus sp. UW140 TaxID=368503 RepID=UPI0031378CEF
YNGNTLLGNATVTATNWIYTATIANATTYDFNVKETDSAGNTSAATSNFTITGDTVAPTGSQASSGATTPAYRAAVTNPYGITNVGSIARHAFVDIDGDGDLDLFIGNQDGNTQIFTNTAASGSTTPAYSAAVTNPYGITEVGDHSSPALTDFDGDGDLDLFIGNKDGNTLIFTNTAASGSTTPAYSAAVTNPYGITNVGNFSSPAFADIDSDGDLDLFIGNKDGNTLLFTNTAASGSTTPAYSAAVTNPYGITDVGNYSSPALADLDGDGDLDLFIGNYDGNTLLFTNTAASGATTPAYSAAVTNPFFITDVGYFASPTFADIDRDGDLDLFIGNNSGNTLLGNNSGNTLLFRNTATTTPLAPVVSTTTNGSYGIGSVVTITVGFSEAVFVTGIPQLQLETGSTGRYATYSSGSGINTLSFQYTVQAGDSSADLDQLSSSALTLNGGTIKDAAGNDAVLTLASPGATGSLAANAALVIDTTAPTGSLGSYATTLAYSAAVTNPYGITDVGYFASPTLADIDRDGDLDLFIGNRDGNTLLFTNTAASGATTPAYSAASPNPFGIGDVGSYASPTLADIDRDGDLDLFIGNSDGNTLLFTNTAALGATTPAYSAAITNPYGITDVGFLASPALADIDRDGDLDLFIGNFDGNTLLFRNTAATTPVAPVVSTTTNGSYGIGSVITITVGFSEAVFVTGIPQLQLETGSTDRYATYSSGSGTNILSFQYTVQAGDSSADLDQLSSSALTLNGGTIKDAAGNDAVLTLANPGATGSLAANAALVIDVSAPTAQDLPYTGSTGQISLARLTTTSGTFTGDVSLNPLVTAPSYANQNVNLSIGKTGLNFSLNLFPASTSKFAKLQFPLAPLLDGFTTTNKRLAYFVYDSPVVGAAPVATPFTYDPIKKAGARFYDLDGNGSADTADLQFVDGGYGDKDGVKNGVVVDPSTAGVVSLNAIFTATATATALTVGDPTDSTSPAALTVRATLTAKAASVNQIGYVALNADEKFDTLTYELVRDRGTILLANLESSDTPNVTGMKFQRDINLINGQKLVFFEVVDTTLESLLAKNTSLQGFGSSFRTLDLSKSTDTAATASKGGNTVALSLLNESAIAGLGDLISSQMADTPILDFTGLQGRTLEDSTVSLAREANYDTTIGFYRIQRADGAVLDPVTNTLITPGSAGYKAAALSSTNLFSGFGTLAVANGATRTETIAAFNEYGLLAPYATVAQTGDTFFSFRSANSDNLNHFRVLGSGVIGLEDLNGGGDQDFDDNIVSFNFKLKGTVA